MDSVTLSSTWLPGGSAVRSWDTWDYLFPSSFPWGLLRLIVCLLKTPVPVRAPLPYNSLSSGSSDHSCFAPSCLEMVTMSHYYLHWYSRIPCLPFLKNPVDGAIYFLPGPGQIKMTWFQFWILTCLNIVILLTFQLLGRINSLFPKGCLNWFSAAYNRESYYSLLGSFHCKESYKSLQKGRRCICHNWIKNLNRCFWRCLEFCIYAFAILCQW